SRLTGLLGTAQVTKLGTALLLRSIARLVAALRPAAEAVPRTSLVPAAVAFGFIAEVAVFRHAAAGTRVRPVLAARFRTVAIVPGPSRAGIGKIAVLRLLPGVAGLAL